MGDLNFEAVALHDDMLRRNILWLLIDIFCAFAFWVVHGFVAFVNTDRFVHSTSKIVISKF